MFKQIRRSNPKFKLALNKSSSQKQRFGASSGKENITPKSKSVKAIAAKSGSIAGEFSVRNMTDKKIHKKPSGYLADVSSDSLYSELADSIMDDSIIPDWDEESSFGFEGAYTPTPLWVVDRTTVQFAFESEEKDAGMANETCNQSDHFEYHLVEDIFDMAMYDIVANDSVELTKKRLPSIVTEGNDEDEDEEDSYVVEGVIANDSIDLTRKRVPSSKAQSSAEDEEEDEESSYVVEGIIANDSIQLTRKRVPLSTAQSSDEDDVESDFGVEGDSEFNADASSSFGAEAVNIPTVIVTTPSDEDLIQETEQDVEYEYEDMLEDGDLAWDLPGIVITSPSDGDITSTISPVVELDYMSIVDQGCKYLPLDGTLHNWNLRFNTGEIFPDHDLRGSGRIEAAGIQLLVSSPSDGDLWVENIIEREFEVADIMDHSYKYYLLDASLHNWSMRFDFENYLRELEGSDDAPYDEDEVY